MLCQNCSQNEATTHIKQIINGEKTESHLCEKCAKELGYGSFFENFSLSIPNIFSSFFGDTPLALVSEKSERCEKCSSSFSDIIRTGMVGCSDCYEKFYDKLHPSIQRIHGRAKHAGKCANIIEAKKVKTEPAQKTTEEKIEELQKEMQLAIERQDFERAAVIRDNIKALKGEQ